MAAVTNKAEDLPPFLYHEANTMSEYYEWEEAVPLYWMWHIPMRRPL
jgi:hypothetical protein